MPYLCSFCDTAYEKWNQLRMHLQTKHPENKTEWPTKDESHVEDLPESVRYVESPRTKKTTTKSGNGGETIEKIGTVKPEPIKSDDTRPATKPGGRVLPEIQSMEAQKLYDLLVLHGISDTEAKSEAVLYEQVGMYREPYNLAQRLRDKFGRRLGSSITVVLNEMFPQSPDGPQYMPPQYGGYGGMGQSYFMQPQSQYPGLHYQPYTPRYNRYGGGYGGGYDDLDYPTSERRPRTDRDDRIGRLEDTLNKFMEKQEKDDIIKKFDSTIDKLKVEHEKEMKELKQEIGSSKDDKRTEWLERFMEERENRFSDLVSANKDQIADLSARLEKATERAKDMYETGWDRAQKERELIERTKAETKDDMVKQGYSSRERDFEERLLDITETQVAPALVSEARETRKVMEKIAERLVTSGSPLGKSVSPEAPNSPIDQDKSNKLSEIMQTRQSMKDLASSK